MLVDEDAQALAQELHLARHLSYDTQYMCPIWAIDLDMQPTVPRIGALASVQGTHFRNGWHLSARMHPCMRLDV